jgi:CRP-like cAMP-binding protein
MLIDYRNMQEFKTFINTKIGITDTEWEVLENTIEVRHYKKGEIIDFPNDIWTEIMYINYGLIRSYIINDAGKDFTRQFYFNINESYTANLFVVDLASMTMQTPSNRGFEVLKESEVLVFTRSHLYHLYQTSKKWEFIGRKMAELAYIDMDTFYYSLLTKTPKERYISLQNSMRNLINIAPQYHIASYIGVTPVTLSRIKKSLEQHPAEKE